MGVERDPEGGFSTGTGGLSPGGASAQPRVRKLRCAPDPYLRRLLGQLIVARARAGLSQQQVAFRLRTTRSAISRLERGRRSRPTLTTIENYALVVGCQVEIRIRYGQISTMSYCSWV